MLTTLNNVGSTTLFKAVFINPEQVVRFYACSGAQPSSPPLVHVLKVLWKHFWAQNMHAFIFLVTLLLNLKGGLMPLKPIYWKIPCADIVFYSTQGSGKVYSLQQRSILNWSEPYTEQERKWLSRNISVSAVDSSNLDRRKLKMFSRSKQYHNFAERAACWDFLPRRKSGLPVPAENAETNGNERHVP